MSEDEEKGFTLVSKLHPAISHGLRKDEDKFDYNKDAGMFVCPAGHMAIRKARQGKKDGKWNQSMTYFFDIEKCKTCSRREGRTRTQRCIYYIEHLYRCNKGIKKSHGRLWGIERNYT